MKTAIVLTFVVLLYPVFVVSQTAYLTVQHPQQTWRYGQGTIEEAALVVWPKGIFMQQDLYLTFSARDLGFSATDSVEIQLNFELQKDACIIDLWLWVGNDIMKALLIDRWTASAIYEGIVKRRRDPALLVKNSAGSYTLRVYPLGGNATRRVMISYLVPMDWTLSTVSCRLPNWILHSSKYLPLRMPLFYKPKPEWLGPVIPEMPSLRFYSVNDSLYGESYRCEVPDYLLRSPVSIAHNSPLKNGIYLNRFASPNEGFYQLAIVPSAVLGMGNQRKVLFLFDHDSIKTSVSRGLIHSLLRTHVLGYYTQTDSINLIVAQEKFIRVSEGWISASYPGVDWTFSPLNQNLVSDFSDLPALLANGIDFILKNGGEGQIVLVAASDRVGDYRVANPVLNIIKQLLKPGIKIHIVDLLNRNYNWYYINGKYYYGNDYFYENLARLSKGTTQNIRSGGTLSTMLSVVSATVRGNIEALDVHTKVDGGFCHSRYSTGETGFHVIPVNKVFFQTGKYLGSFPFTVEVAGVYEGKAGQKQVVIHESVAEPLDSTSVTAWTGNYISALEALPTSNATNKAIVDASMQRRILCRLTAFLALEPNDTVKAITPTPGPGGATSVRHEQPIVPEDLLLQAYPNPFNLTTNILVRLPSGTTWGEVTVKIYNALGQVIRSFDASALSDTKYHRFTWDGRNDAGGTVSSGVYYLVLTTGKGRYTLKLMLVK